VTLVPVDRFLGTKIRKRIWIVADPIRRKSHWKAGMNSLPCQEPHHCELCELQTKGEWTVTVEGYAAAYLFVEAKKSWVPIVAVFTQGLLRKLGNGPHRGRQLVISRVKQGAATVLNFEELVRAEPLNFPAFDVRPHLERMWFPGERHAVPKDLPKEIPADCSEQVDLSPAPPSDRERELVRAMLQKAREDGKIGKAPGSLPARIDPSPNRINAKMPGDHLPDVQNPVPTAQNRTAPAPRGTFRPSRVASTDDLGGLDAELDAILRQGTGEIITREVGDSLPDDHPAKPRHAHRNGTTKGGVK
jgi:hypothetical protein